MSDAVKAKMAELARIWRGGCIICARLLGTIIDAYTRNPELPSLLLDPAVATMLKLHADDLRACVQVRVH